MRMLFAVLPAGNFEFNPETGLISAYVGTDVDVVVPRKIGGVTVTGFENDMVFESCRDYTNTETASNQTDWVHLRTLVLPETIQEIPDGLLNYCQQLETFVCYAPVESTGKSTFALCRCLKTAAFMNGVRVIDSYAFDSTDALESLYFGSHVQKIAANAFNFSGITYLVIDADEIETGAFTACPNLTSLHMTAKVRTIGETFALECPNLSELCFDGPITNSLLLLTAAPQLTVRVAEDADENTRSLAQNCMSWSENPSEVTVTEDKCAHARPERPDAAAMLPEWALSEGGEAVAQPEMPVEIEATAQSEATVEPEAPVETEAPVESEAPVLQGDLDLAGILETRFIMTDADMNGYNMTPEALGGYEYSLVFHEDGTADFVMAGTAIPMLKWSYGEMNGIVIDFSGQPLNVVPTEKGLDMDYFGTMLMHFAPEAQ